MDADILLATINAKWIHPSLALRLLKANLGSLEGRCEIMEFALRQPLREKTEPLLAVRPRILGLSVSIWNHTATLELLKELHKAWEKRLRQTKPEAVFFQTRPFVVLGGPEVSHLPPDAEIFRYADCCIKGEGEIAFKELCETFLRNNNFDNIPAIINGGIVDVNVINNGYRLYTDEDLQKKLVYAEASRGCRFACDFCLSSVSGDVREFPLEAFFEEMTDLIRRGVKTVKFLDRSFNLNIERAKQIMNFFLEKINERMTQPLVAHFETVPFRFPLELTEIITRFPPGSLRLEIGIQTLNPKISACIGRASDPARELDNLRFLGEKTTAVIHADLIAGLPGEDMASFGRGFDLLWDALSPKPPSPPARHVEIQLGILKLLPGTPIARHTAAFGMRYNPLPPYEVTETAALPADDLDRIKNFARFWEIIVNRKLADVGPSPVFHRFMSLSDLLYSRFGRNWGIDKTDLTAAVREWGANRNIVMRN